MAPSLSLSLSAVRKLLPFSWNAWIQVDAASGMSSHKTQTMSASQAGDVQCGLARVHVLEQAGVSRAWKHSA